jgi:diguanylate cyclase (GGDEF)-like protein
MDPATIDLETFVASAERVVEYLRSHTCLTDWSVSRIDGGEQVHLHVSGEKLLHVGDRVPWEDTFCRRMLAGAANVVVDSQRDPDYAELPAAADVRSYAGVPIVEGDGSLFGTLCGTGAEPLRSREQIDAEMLRVFSDLLSAQLYLVRASAAHQQVAVSAAALANTDGLTTLMNRRGWDIITADAEERVVALGDHGGVVVIDLDGLKTVNDTAGHQAGDELIRTAAQALRGATRPGDSVARFGGDEFVVYVEGVPVADLDAAARRYADAIAAAGVAASLGAAPVVPTEGRGCVARALAEADALMYADKSARRAARG